jgi:hypothetical protein
VIFYDSNYNFQSVDESLFQTLKFSSLDTMRSAIRNDFTNLFFKSEFYIYKFEKVCWLETLLQSNEKAILRFGDDKLYKVDLYAKSIESGFKIEIGKILEFLEVAKIDRNEFEKFFKLFKSVENRIDENLNIDNFKEIHEDIFELKRFSVFFNITELKKYIHEILDELKKEFPDFQKVTFLWLDFSTIMEDGNLSFKSL